MRIGSKAVERRAQRNFPPGVVRQLADLETDLGGRDALVGMLTLAPLTPDLEYILGMLGDPASAGRSLAEICAQGNILPGELLQQLGSAAMLRGKVLAAQQIARGVAAVAADVMRRAAPYEEPCYQCQGTGTITPDPTAQVPNPAPGPCELCKGCGRLLHQPDLDRQKLAIEMAQLLPKGGAINIQNNNIAAGGAASGGGPLGSLANLHALTDALLYGPGGPVRPGGSGAADVDDPTVVDADLADGSAPGAEG